MASRTLSEFLHYCITKLYFSRANSESLEKRNGNPSPNFRHGRRIAAFNSEGLDLLHRKLLMSYHWSSAAVNAKDDSARLGSPAAHASARTWQYRSHHAHNAGVVSLTQKVEPAAFQDYTRVYACSLC